MADVAPGTLDTTTAPAADTAATPSPSPSESSATPAVSATADDTVSKVRRIYDSLEEGSSPSASATPPPPAQAAIAPDGTTAATQVPATAKGPIPFSDHERVVKTTRTKTRNETLTEYGIGETHQPNFVRNALVLGELAETDPRKAIRLLQSLLAEEATAAPSPPAEKPPTDPEPEPDIPLADGSYVYSAKQQHAREQWFERQLLAKVEKTYGPMRDAHELQQITGRQATEARNIVAEASAEWPLFDQLRPYIAKRIEAMPGKLTPTALERAYIGAYKEHGLRLQREAWEQERVSTVALKTSGSSARPSAAQPITPRTGKLSTVEKVRQIYDRLETAGTR